jgi:hypothetical protein
VHADFSGNVAPDGATIRRGVVCRVAVCFDGSAFQEVQQGERSPCEGAAHGQV